MPHRLGRLQMAIMRVLWTLRKATVADVQAELEAEHGAAYTTVATVLKRMEAKGLVRHQKAVRSFVYEPVLSENEVGTSVVTDVVDRLFEGSPSQLVSHLLDSEQIDADELDRIKQMIVRHERTLPSRKKGQR